jgi:hypothetical protein
MNENNDIHIIAVGLRINQNHVSRFEHFTNFRDQTPYLANTSQISKSSGMLWSNGRFEGW